MTGTCDRPGPLDGIRVVDCSTVLAGPYCTMLLGDLGADVVKVEPPEGDATRAWGPPWVGEGSDRTAAYYLAVNRNKRSIRLDLRTDAGRDVLRRLIERADVLVENARVGGLARLGFPDDELERLNPGLIHVAISGYGSDGPDDAKPGYDFIAQAVGGLMSITGAPDERGGEPTKVGVAVSDIATGLFAAVGALASMVARGRHGSRLRGLGERVDVSLLESTLALLINQAQNAFVTGRSPTRRGNAHPNIVPYEAFDAADRPIVVAIGSERQWPRFCEALGMPHLAEDPRFRTNGDRVAAREQLRPFLAARLAELPAAEWLARLEAADVPCGRINDVLSAIESAQARARGMDVTLAHPRLGPVRQVGVPIKLRRGRAEARTAPPLLDEQGRDILADLGYSDEEIDALAAGSMAPPSGPSAR